MYVTRPLSVYKRSPELLSSSPPKGPNSGILVVQDEESETTTCFGLCRNRYLKELPFPQNKRLTVSFSTDSGEASSTSYDEALLIPVLNQPLSLNYYYAIKSDGSHKGEAYTNSREEDMTTCCFCTCVKDVKPRPLDPNDPYQQFEISTLEGCCGSHGGFTAKSVGPDGYPPLFLRRRGWGIYTKTPKHWQLGEANGLDASRRAHLPELNFSVSRKSSDPVVVGKWYCPFVFVKEEELALKKQIKMSPFYEITLEQRWGQIFSCENDDYTKKGNAVDVDVFVRTEEVSVGGREILHDDIMEVNGEMKFKGQGFVGLSMVVIQRMKWEQERFGYNSVDGKQMQVRVKRVEEFTGVSGWRRFGCYVLVESFVLKRNDGNIVLKYEFKHIQHIKSIWE